MRRVPDAEAGDRVADIVAALKARAREVGNSDDVKEIEPATPSRLPTKDADAPRPTWDRVRRSLYFLENVVKIRDVLAQLR